MVKRLYSTCLTPWYRGFKGNIREDGLNRFTTEVITNGTKEYKNFTELPISMWTNKFKEFLRFVGGQENQRHEELLYYQDVNFVLRT